MNDARLLGPIPVDAITRDDVLKVLQPIWLKKPETVSRLLHSLDRASSYAPHLNLIERLWAVLHACSTRNRFYNDFNMFAAAILKFFRETITKEWKTLRDKVTDNFRIISHQDFRIFG